MIVNFFCSDQVKNVPEQIEKHKKQKYYLHATELLVSTGTCTCNKNNKNNIIFNQAGEPFS